MKKLELYHLPGCPFCAKVRNYMKENGIDIPMKSTEDLDNREELIAIGGKSQVPCLMIDGKALYESDDIIEWFKKQKSEDKKEWIELVHNRSTCDA